MPKVEGGKVEGPIFHDHMTAEEISAALDALVLPGTSDGVVTATQCSEPELLAHGAIRFELRLPAGRDVREVLSELLGAEDAEKLIADWAAERVTISGLVPETSVAVFFPNSNSKTRENQEADFKRAGLAGFADDVEATLVCAALVQKARDAGIDLRQCGSEWQATDKLSNQELDLLTKLRDGLVRTSSGALGVDDNGRLRANYYCDYGYPYYWAAGAAPAAESKT